MNPLYISEPCSENWALMTPTEKGAYCAACATEVIDFSTKSPGEITAILRKNFGEKVCGRIATSQLDTFNRAFAAWESSRVQHLRVASYLALIAVFGMTLFSCQSPEAEASLKQWQRTALVSALDNEKQMHAQLELPLDESKFELQNVRSLEYICRQYSREDYKIQENVEQILETETRVEDVMMGALVYEERFVEYLDLIPTEAPERYDRNGVLIPTVHEDLVYPNPTSGEAKYKLALPENGIFVIGLYDMSGRHIRNLHEGDLEAGTHEFDLNFIDEQAGTFLVVCRSKNFSNTQRLIKF